MPATEARAIEGLTTGQAARLLGLSEQSTRALVRAGKLRATVTPLGMVIDEDDAHRLAEQRDRAAREKPRRRGGRS